MFNFKSIVITVLIVVCVAAGFYFLKGGALWRENSPWYAVHLNNNQVYFGHMSSRNDDTIILSDTYYLQVYGQDGNTSASSNFSVSQSPTYGLTRRGDDTTLSSDHKIFINRAAVLFWEKLSDDSEIVKLTKEYHEKRNKLDGK